MSIELIYDCEMQAGYGLSYWWPLLCEILHDHDFHFGDPSLPGKTSIYFYHRHLPPYEGEKEEAESRIGTFRDMWDEVLQEAGGITVPFWWKDKDFSMDVASSLSTSTQRSLQVYIEFSLIRGQIADSTPEEAKIMINLACSCLKDLYKQCNPVSAKIYWQDTERVYDPWALFGKIAPDPRAERGPARHPAGIHIPEYRLIEEPLTHGNALFQFDPIPVPSKHSWEKDVRIMGWEFLSLVS